MNIILLNNFCKRKGSVELCVPSAFSLALVGFFLIVGISAGTGFYFGQQQVADDSSSSQSMVDIAQILDADRALLDEEKAQLQAHLDALAIRLGSLQAHMMRIAVSRTKSCGQKVLPNTWNCLPDKSQKTA